MLDNFFNKLLRLKIFNTSLQVKITLIFIIPVILTMALLAYYQIRSEKLRIQAQSEMDAIWLSNMTLASLNHAMYDNDKDMLSAKLADMKDSSLAEDIRIINTNATIYDSTIPSEIGKTYEVDHSGCIECHKFSSGERPRSMRLQIDNDTLRVATVIANLPQCHQCHASTKPHLGILLIDSSLVRSEQQLRVDMLNSIAISITSILIVMALLFALIQWLVVRRVDVIRSALTDLGTQNFSRRITQQWRTQDELTRLSDTFNSIAANLEALQAESAEKGRVRTLAIIEERERIARELHDGVAQFLAYLSTKIGAIRMELSNKRIETADKNLQQAEQAIRNQSIEVRSAIIGLKMSGEIEKGLIHNVRMFIDQCNLLDDMAIELYVSSEAREPKLDSGKELQLIRILQEALSNVRKHARASEGSVHLEVESGWLKMVISDNGIGFDPLQIGLERVGHFGLQIIFERAHEIGANVEIISAHSKGTKVIITMEVPEA